MSRVSRVRQAGFTLIELLLATVFTGLALIAYFQLHQRSLDEISDTNVSSYQNLITEAAKRYVKANFSSITAVATPTTPAKITVGMLKTTGFLSASVNGTNGYGQTPCVLALEPTANKLEVVVTTEGGQAIDGLRGPAIAAGMNYGAFLASGSTANGMKGGLSVSLTNYMSDNCSGTSIAPGHLVSALFFDNGDVVSDYLYRSSVPGHPEVNRMNTRLDMGGNRLGGLVVVAVNTACTVTGDMAQGPAGEVLSCQGGQYKPQTSPSYWKDPVASYPALPMTGNTVGDVRLVTGLSPPRPFAWTGAAWAALVLNQNGDFTVPGELWVTGNAHITGSSSSFTHAPGMVTTAGSSCSGYTSGAWAKTSSGAPLYCQSGVWSKQVASSLLATTTVWGNVANVNFTSSGNYIVQVEGTLSGTGIWGYTLYVSCDGVAAIIAMNEFAYGGGPPNGTSTGTGSQHYTAPSGGHSCSAYYGLGQRFGTWQHTWYGPLKIFVYSA